MFLSRNLLIKLDSFLENSLELKHSEVDNYRCWQCWFL